MVKISVLMYVSNAEKYLNDSLDSLLNQSFHDFELICIDDKSKDDSLAIMKAYSKKFAHFKIISLNNSNYQGAINKCIDWIDSKYVYFMDAHNILKSDALSKLFNESERNNVDFLICDSFNDKILDSYIINKHNNKNKLIQYTRNTFNYTELRENLFDFDISLESKMYKVDFIKNNNIKLFEDYQYGEYVFFYKSLLSADRICYISDSIFEDNSLNIMPAFTTDLSLCDYVKISEKIIEVFKDYDEFNKYKRLLYNKSFDFLINYYYRIDEDYKEKYFNNMKNMFVDILKNITLGNDYIKTLNYHNRKLFEQILISENIYVFELLRKTYLDRINYDNLVNKNACLKSYLNEKVIE